MLDPIKTMACSFLGSQLPCHELLYEKATQQGSNLSTQQPVRTWLARSHNELGTDSPSVMLTVALTPTPQPDERETLSHLEPS